MNKVCPVCGVSFDREPKVVCCSKSCARRLDAQRNGGHPHNWKGGRWKINSGYWKVLRPDHPAADARGYVLEHRLVMEAILGRFLGPRERVHHRNGVRDDNDPSNLELWRLKDPPGIRAADYHCAGCVCAR